MYVWHLHVCVCVSLCLYPAVVLMPLLVLHLYQPFNVCCSVITHTVNAMCLSVYLSMSLTVCQCQYLSCLCVYVPVCPSSTSLSLSVLSDLHPTGTPWCRTRASPGRSGSRWTSGRSPASPSSCWSWSGTTSRQLSQRPSATVRYGHERLRDSSGRRLHRDSPRMTGHGGSPVERVHYTLGSVGKW